MLFKSKKIVGIDIGSSSIKVAELSSSKAGYTLDAFGFVQTPADAINGGEILQAGALAMTIRSLIDQVSIKKKNVATNIWGAAVIVKKITMPRMEESLVNEQIKWEAEQYIPYDINEISLEFHILKGSGMQGDTMDVLLIAAKKEFVHSYVNVISEAGLECSVLDISNFAIANCFEANYGTFPETLAVINIGAKVTNFVVLENGEVSFCRDMPIGGMNYTNDIHKEMGVSLEEAESLKLSAVMQQQVPEQVNGIIQSTSEVVADEIQNSFDFYMATATSSGISRFYVTGGGAGIPGLVQHVSQQTGVAFEVMNPFSRINFDMKKFSLDYIEQIKPYVCVSMGLGLRKVGDA